MTTAYRGRQGAHQNRRVQRFAFCRGLDFTLGYSGSIVPAGAGVERRSAALAAVRLSLLLEATAGMLEISPPSGSAGRALRTTGFCPATPWIAAYQAPLSMGFSRQEYWSGVPLPSPKGKMRPLPATASQGKSPVPP